MYDYGVFEELGTAIDELDIPTDSTALAAVVGLRDRLDARISDAVAAHDHAGLWELDGATLHDRLAGGPGRHAPTAGRRHGVPGPQTRPPPRHRQRLA